MKLLRVGAPGREVPAVLDDMEVPRDLSSIVRDIDADLLAADGLDMIRAVEPTTLPALERDGMRIGPPIRRPGKIVCIGLNYHDHACETSLPVPDEPVIFMKAPDTIVGPFDTVLIPRSSIQTDWEVELAVVIGRTAVYLGSPEDSRAVIAGFAISHDVSERRFQLDCGGQWDKGKNCATFNPLGPWLVTADEVNDPQALMLSLTVNEITRQNGSTADMIFPVDYIVWYVSQFMTLYPGDVINTGTPAGVALGLPEPKPYLRPGDVVELQISGLGLQRQVVGRA